MEFAAGLSGAGAPAVFGMVAKAEVGHRLRSVSQEDADQRVRRLLPPLVSLELLVLKGHLLVEEQLQLFLETLRAFSQLL